VILLDLKDITWMVVIEHVTSLPLLDCFHGVVIIEQYFSIGIEEALDFLACLFQIFKMIHLKSSSRMLLGPPLCGIVNMLLMHRELVV
jgi:hypothetical protein